MILQQIELFVYHDNSEIVHGRLPLGEYVVGSDEGCEIALGVDGVSPRHARLLVTQEAVFVEDLGNTGGVWISDQQITEAANISPGTRFKVGEAEIEWRIVAAGVVKAVPAGVRPTIAAARRPQANRSMARVSRRGLTTAKSRDYSSLAVVLVLLGIVGGGGYFLVKSLNTPADAPAKTAGQQVARNNTPAPTPARVAAEPEQKPVVISRAEPPKPVATPEPAKKAPMPPPVEVKPTAPVATKPADDYPGVPNLNLSPNAPTAGADLQQLLAAGAWAGTNGKWDRLQSDLRGAIIKLAETGGSIAQPANIEKIPDLRLPSTAMAQERFITAVGPSVLKAFTADKERAGFTQWTLARPEVLSAFNNSVQPQNKLREALQTWYDIWKSDEEGREQFTNLAIACALVFDRPVKINPSIFGTGGSSQSDSPGFEKEVSAVKQYRFFRDSAKRGALRAPITEMTPEDLIWVVDAPIPESELAWAQKNMSLSRQTWGKAYSMIRYRMDRATQGVNPYKAYTLAEIQKEGGICGDQAYFASMTAKANGIPAMVITGEGDRGAHAWFGYKAARNAWNLTSGRYNDSYAAGTSKNPQTRQPMKEHELKIYSDPVRRTDAYSKSEHIAALGRMFAEAKHDDLAGTAINVALRLAPKNIDAWFAKMDSLRASKIDSANWQTEVAKMRTAFQGYSDLVQKIDKMASDYLSQIGDHEAARKLVRLDAARINNKDKERTDLILDGIFREADLAEAAGDSDKIGRIYREAMTKKGDEVAAFKKIAKRYYDWGTKNSKGETTTRDIINAFEQKHKEPSGDVFAIGAYLGVLKQLIAMTKEQGMTSQEHNLERRETKLQALKEKLGKDQSKNAAR